MAERSPLMRMKEDEPHCWSKLGSLPLEKIYTFLNRVDQANMALVCKNWCKEFNSCSFFTFFRFDLINSMDNCRIMSFVRDHCRKFKHVQIDCNAPMVEVDFSIWLEHFKDFLQLLSGKSQLESVKFNRLRDSLVHMRNLNLERLFRMIHEFLESQRQLKRMEFHQCYFTNRENVQTLMNSVVSRKATLRHLVLEGFKSGYCKQVLRNEQILPTLAVLSDLETLKIDYLLILGGNANSSRLIETFNFRKEIILKILMLVDEMIDLEGMDHVDWRLLIQEYPYMEVELVVGSYSASLHPVEFFIKDYMPITHLKYHYRHRNRDQSSSMEFDSFLNHLLSCKTTDSLISLYLRWEQPISNLEDTFVPFINACKRLQSLEFSTVYMAPSLENLFQSLLENPPNSLQKVVLNISGVYSEAYYMELKNLVSRFKPLLKLTKLVFKINFHLDIPVG